MKNHLTELTKNIDRYCRVERMDSAFGRLGILSNCDLFSFCVIIDFKKRNWVTRVEFSLNSERCMKRVYVDLYPPGENGHPEYPLQYPKHTHGYLSNSNKPAWLVKPI